MIAEFLVIRGEYHVQTHVEQEVRVMISNLIPRSEVMQYPTGAHILLIRVGEIISGEKTWYFSFLCVIFFSDSH